ncbi:MAG: flavin monoamine oxidase family protein [Acetobacteraceae bacterium]
MNACDVVVVGAGAAGLGAAHTLQAAAQTVIVLEASGRIGGRAWTAFPAALGGDWFDMGAQWLHNSETNPLVPIADHAGERLLNADRLRSRRTFVGGRLASAAELADYAAAWLRFSARADELLRAAGQVDASLSDVARSLPFDPWALTVEAWEGPVIDAADANAISLRDWQANRLTGSNVVPQGGIGRFVQGQLAAGLEIRLGTPARGVQWGGPVTIVTDEGTLRAEHCIVTASTGVLAEGTIAFEPQLPAEIAAAIAALPMGLALKVLLRARGEDRLDLPAHCVLDQRCERSGDALMVFQCWPYGRDYVQGWIGGAAAWALARQGDGAAGEFALAALGSMYGAHSKALFDPLPALVTHWEQDPWVRGAYCYARPGQAGARKTLGLPLGGGRLIFAGEACHDRLAGTLGGAWESGVHAARVLLGAVR